MQDVALARAPGAAIVMDEDIPDGHAEILELVRKNPDGFAVWAYSASKKFKSCDSKVAKSEPSIGVLANR